MAPFQDRRFDELYSRYFREVLAYCMRRDGADDAYDAANEVFAIAWRRLADIPAGEAVRPWLYVVARRVLYRRRRGALRFRRLVEKAGGIRHHGSPDPETVVVQRAEYAAVLEAASHLRIEIDSMPAELDEITRRVMRMEIEETALKKEKDKASKERLNGLRKELR